MTTISMTILASTPDTAKATKYQLETVFGDIVHFKIVVFNEDLQHHSITDDFVLITNKIIKQEALRYIKPGTKYFVTDRTINTQSIEKLYSIPAKETVYVYNVSKETIDEAMDQLINLGINHINFLPYTANNDPLNENLSFLIIFGELNETLPKNKYKVIDLGTRPIDIASIVKIAIKTGIYKKVKHNIAAESIRPIIRSSYNYSKQLKEIQSLTGNLQLVLNQFNGSVILVDQHNKIIFHNPKAKQLLQIKNQTSPFLPALLKESEKKENEFFFKINQQTYYIESLSDDHRNGISTVFIINDMENIQKVEKDYRTSLLKSGFITKYTFHDIIHESEPMKELISQSKQFSSSDSTIAIYGESGSGKELIAQAIHYNSPRRNQPFVSINFAALSPTLVEAELFGYAKGAFTGAKKEGRKGIFELAHKGTIFLDEIGDCPLDIQRKLLRVIQEREVLPIGGDKLIPIDVRIITATNKNLYQMIRKNEFRKDLYYRINVLPLHVPPLRDRKEDIILLFNHFLKNIFNIDCPKLKPELKQALLNHHWDGNVRELRNVAEYLANFIPLGSEWEDQVYEILTTEDHLEENATEDNMNSILEALEAEYEIELLYHVLKTINQPPHIWSRQTIVHKIGNSNFTESKVKRAISILNKNDLIYSRPGKGSYIAQLGKEFLDFYSNAYTTNRYKQ